MGDATSNDGRYYAVQQGDGNFVVYDRLDPNHWVPAWDRWSWEAAQGSVTPQPPPVEPPPVNPPSPPRPPSHGFRVVRVTDDRDGTIPPRMYSYWSNAVVIGDYVYVFCGNADGVARFFKVHPNDTVERLPNYVGAYRGETEGWYWRRDGWLYTFNVGEDSLHCVNPFGSEDQTVLKLDGRYAGGNIWQPHSSDDGRVHVATVKDSSWRKVAMAMSVDGRMSYAPAFGDLDECHVSGDGHTAIMEEDNNTRIVDIATGRERLITNADGALAHLDCGPDYMVGEDDQTGACVKQHLVTLERTVLFSTWGMGHVSVRNGMCLLSRMEPQNDICWVGMNGEGISPILQHRMSVKQRKLTVTRRPDFADYDHQVKANLDYTASVAVYMSNAGGSRQDVYLARF